MKYYLESFSGARRLTTKEDYYSKRRRKNTRELILYQNGAKTGRILKNWQK